MKVVDDMIELHRDDAYLRAIRENVIYWMVTCFGKVRHGVLVRPGQWPDGTEVTTIGGTCGPVRTPFSTPLGREPKSAAVTTRCPRCVDFYERMMADYECENWDI